MSKAWFFVNVQLTESSTTIYGLVSEHSYKKPKSKPSSIDSEQKSWYKPGAVLNKYLSQGLISYLEY